jgi:hypothetical protein
MERHKLDRAVNMNRIIASLVWLTLFTGAALAQCAGGISNCPPAAAVAPTDWTVVAQPGGTGPTDFVTRKATVAQLGGGGGGFNTAANYVLTGTWAFQSIATAVTQPTTDASGNIATTAFVQNVTAPVISQPYTTRCNPTGVPQPVIDCLPAIVIAPLTVTQGSATVAPILDGGFFTVLDSTTGNSIVLGMGAFKTQSASPASYKNIAIGANSMGGFTGPGLTTAAVNNISLGAVSLGALVSGNSNIAIGLLTLSNNISGNENNCIGYSACGGLGSDNTAVGLQALATSGGSGSSNSAFGPRSGYYVTSGGSNSFYGATAGQYTSTGSGNIIIGAGSTGGSSSTVLLTGSNNVVLGGNITNLTTDAGTIQIGDGAGNVRWDYGKTTASATTINTALRLPALATTGTAGNTLCWDSATNAIFRKAGTC